MQKVLVSEQSIQTENFGESIGCNLKGTETIELISDLGGGKTTFVRGLASGAGSKDKVSSPTFTISKIYKTASFDIHHFDFYRLTEPGLIQHELGEILDYPKSVVITEWGEALSHLLPDSRLTIKIKRGENDSRIIEFNYSKELSYLMKGLN